LKWSDLRYVFDIQEVGPVFGGKAKLREEECPDKWDSNTKPATDHGNLQSKLTDTRKSYAARGHAYAARCGYLLAQLLHRCGLAEAVDHEIRPRAEANARAILSPIPLVKPTATVPFDMK